MALIVTRSFQILSSVPLWVGELAPPKIRGIMTDIHAVGMMVGYTVSIYVGLGFYFVSGSNQWRGPLGLQMALPTIILCGIYWMPESPRYLLSKAKFEQAWAIVHRMHSDPNDPNDEFAKREFYQMRKQIELDVTFATSYWEIFKKPSLRKRAYMTIFLEFCLMSSGILVVLSESSRPQSSTELSLTQIDYGSIIYATLGFDTVQILNFQGGFQLTGFVFNIVAMTFVDRVPRNKLISLGFISCSITVSILTALQSHYIGTTDRSGLIACVAMIFLFQTVYSLFLDGATFFYLTGMPTEIIILLYVSCIRLNFSCRDLAQPRSSPRIWYRDGHAESYKSHVVAGCAPRFCFHRMEVLPLFHYHHWDWLPRGLHLLPGHAAQTS